MQKDQQSLTLRAVDHIKDCHGEMWRRNAESKMKIFGMRRVWVHRIWTTFSGDVTSTTGEISKVTVTMGSRWKLFDKLERLCDEPSSQ